MVKLLRHCECGEKPKGRRTRAAMYAAAATFPGSAGTGHGDGPAAGQRPAPALSIESLFMPSGKRRERVFLLEMMSGINTDPPIVWIVTDAPCHAASQVRQGIDLPRAQVPESPCVTARH